MPRRARPDRCRVCGDLSALDPDTFAPTGLCDPCAAPAVKAARRVVRAVRRADRETVVTVDPITCPTCEGPLHVSHATPEEAARRGYQCDTCADTLERGGDLYA